MADPRYPSSPYPAPPAGYGTPTPPRQPGAPTPGFGVTPQPGAGQHLPGDLSTPWMPGGNVSGPGLAQGAGYNWDPVQGSYVMGGTAKGKNAGEALKALQDASGLNLLGSSGVSGVGGGLPSTISMPDTSAARTAAFGRAKDQSGQTARAAIDALRGEMAGRGLLGSGIEGGRTAEIVGQAAQGSNEVSREQAIQDAANAARMGEMQYQGGITQRGQDISALEAEKARQAQAMQGLLSMVNSSGLLY